MQNERISASFTSGDRTVKVTTDEVIFIGSTGVETRYLLNQIVLAKESGGFGDPRSYPTELKFYIVTTGQEFAFSGPGIDEFYEKIQPLIANK